MRSLLILSVLALVLSACATKEERREQSQLKEEMAKTSPPKSDAEMYQEEKELLKTTSSLTPEQKLQLSELMKKSRKENQEIQNEISQTKLILFKELLSEKENKSKISILENKLVKLNRKKTRYSFNTYKEAKAIVGKNDESLERTLQLIDQRSLRESTL